MKKTLALLICTTIAHGAYADEFLRPDEIKSLLVGKKALVRTMGSFMVDLELRPDFTSSSSALGGDSGKWRFSDDGYCIAWTKLREGVETCFKVAKKGMSHVIVAPNGSIANISRID